MPGRRTPIPDMAPKENSRTNSSRRGASLQPMMASSLDDDYETALSRETLSRRQDQRIKDDLTNKLYQIDLDRVKPGFQVQLQTGFRKNIYPKRGRRRYSSQSQWDESSAGVGSGGGARKTVWANDPRRYSTAGNLEIYRVKPTTPATRRRAEEEFSFERPPPDSRPASSLAGFYQDYYRRSQTAPVAVSPYNPYRPYGYGVPDYGRTTPSYSSYQPSSGPVDEYELRKLAELRVKGRETSNGPKLTTYDQLVTSYNRPSSTPSADYWRQPASSSYSGCGAAVGAQRYNRPTTAGASNTWGRQLNESRYELGEFERLMRKTFGGDRPAGGGGGAGGSIRWEAYPAPPPPPSVHYTTVYSEPYYRTVYEPYAYGHQVHNPIEYNYTLYSPPTRVTRPGEYVVYSDSTPYGRSVSSSSSYLYPTYNWNRY